MKTKIILGCLIVTSCFIGCSDDDDDDDVVDANGRHDMQEAHLYETFLAIGTSCAKDPTAPPSPTNETECRALCDCTTDAIADLEQKEDAPAVRATCYNMCRSDFNGTSDEPIHVDDADHLPDYEEFYIDYILACDETAHEITHGTGDTLTECKSTCNCLADHVEETFAEGTSATFRDPCLANCDAAAPKGLSAHSNLQLWFDGGVN